MAGTQRFAIVEGSGEHVAAIGDYTIERELRTGGMGVVYLVRKEGVDEPLALKMALRDDELTLARFTQEIRATRSLNHPGIVKVLDEGFYQNLPWYVMRFVGAVNLADVLAVRDMHAPADLASLVAGIARKEFAPVPAAHRRGLPLTTAVAVMERVASAVAHAHARGVLHRDIKPANIILTRRGDPVLADFGVARKMFDSLRLTAADEVVGTYTYIAPEQLAGEAIDERADVYGLGAVLYECVVGHPPERRTSGCEPLAFPRSIPAPLRAIIMRSLEPERRYRMANATILLAELRRFQQGEAVRSRPPALVRRIGYIANRHVVISAVALALFVVALFLAIIANEISSRSRVAWEPQFAAELGAGSLGSDGADGLRALVGAWRGTQGGLQSIPQGEAQHCVFGVTVPAVTGQRVTAEAHAGEKTTSEISVFLGSDADWQSGYRFQLGAFENSCSVLRRGAEILWIGAGRVEPGRAYSVELERIGDVVSARVNGTLVTAITDLVPPRGDTAGAFTWVSPTSGAQPRFTHLSVARAEVPRLVEPDTIVARMLQAAEQVDGLVQQEIVADATSIADDLLRRLGPEDPRYDRVLLRRGVLIGKLWDYDRSAHDAELIQRQARLATLAAYHIQRFEGSDLTDDDPRVVRYVDDAMRQLRDRDELVRYACWLTQRIHADAMLAAYRRLADVFSPGTIFGHYLAMHAAGYALYLLGDLRLARDMWQRIDTSGLDSLWAQQARQHLREWRFRDIDFTRMTLDERDALLGSDPGTHGARLLTIALLGGPLPAPDKLDERQRHVRDCLAAALAAQPLPQPDRSLTGTLRQEYLEWQAGSALLRWQPLVRAGAASGAESWPGAFRRHLLAIEQSRQAWRPERAIALRTLAAGAVVANFEEAQIAYLRQMIDPDDAASIYAGFVVLLARHRSPVHWLANADPAMAAAIEAVFNGTQAPLPPLDSPLGPLLYLCEGRRALAHADHERASEVLLELARGREAWPETWCARQLLDQQVHFP